MKKINFRIKKVRRISVDRGHIRANLSRVLANHKRNNSLRTQALNSGYCDFGCPLDWWLYALFHNELPVV